MIEYSIKDLLLVVLKKCYIMFLCAGFCILLAVFNEETSYEKVLENYNKYTDADFDEGEDTSYSSYCLISCTSKPGVEWSNADSAYIVYTLLNNNTLRSNLDLEDVITITLIRDSNILLCESQSLSKTQFVQQMEEIRETLQTSILEKNIDVQLGDIDSQVKVANSEEKYAEKVMKRPSRATHKVQLYVRAAIFGILMSVILILIIEYVKGNKNAIKV